MRFKRTMAGEVTVLAISGSILGGDDYEAFANQIRKSIETGSVDVVLDLSRVNRVSSCGLGLILTGFTSLARAGGLMKLARVPSPMGSLLTVTKLRLVFETFDSVEEAVASFDETPWRGERLHLAAQRAS